MHSQRFFALPLLAATHVFSTATVPYTYADLELPQGFKSMTTRVRLRNWVPVVILEVVLTARGGWEPTVDTSWSVVHHSANTRLQAAGNHTFALVRNTLLAGDVLADGSSNLQDSVADCAASCSAQEWCSGYNYCAKGGCPLDPGSSPRLLPAGGCELRFQGAAAVGMGVFQLATGGSSLGDAGVKLLVTTPKDPPAGYQVFQALALHGNFNMQCLGSAVPGICVLIGTMEAVASRCNSMPACQGFVYRPHGHGNLSDALGTLKGSGDGEPLDPSQGYIDPTALFVGRVDRLDAAAAAAAAAAVPGSSSQVGDSETAAGLSSVAVAGIAVSCTLGLSCLGIAAGLAYCWRRSHRTRGCEPQDSLVRSSTSSKDTTDLGDLPEGGQLPQLVVRRPSSEAQAEAHGLAGNPVATHPATPPSTPPAGSPTRLLASQLFESIPNPQWEDLVVPYSQIEWCTRPDGQLMRLGGGASGNVYQVMLRDQGTVCACKVFDFSKNQSLPKHFIQEAFLLRKLKSPVLVQFYGVSMTESKGLLLMELMGKDLSHALQVPARSSRGGRLYGWHNRGQRTALQVAAGLAYLHSRGIVHLDLKPQNILLSKDGSAKIADVGFSKRLRRNNQLSSLPEGRIGTFDFCAPEILMGGQVCEKADIYSFGVILAEIITGEEARRGLMPSLLVPEQCPAAVAALQARCMAPDPAERPSAAEIIELLQSLPAPAPTPPATPPQPQIRALPPGALLPTPPYLLAGGQLPSPLGSVSAWGGGSMVLPPTVAGLRAPELQHLARGGEQAHSPTGRSPTFGPTTPALDTVPPSSPFQLFSHAPLPFSPMPGSDADPEGSATATAKVDAAFEQLPRGPAVEASPFGSMQLAPGSSQGSTGVVEPHQQQDALRANHAAPPTATTLPTEGRSFAPQLGRTTTQPPASKLVSVQPLRVAVQQPRPQTALHTSHSAPSVALLSEAATPAAQEEKPSTGKRPQTEGREPERPPAGLSGPGEQGEDLYRVALGYLEV